MDDFHPAQYNKAWVALIMSALIIIEEWTGWSGLAGLTEQGITIILSLITPLLVWITPNRQT
jgi:hypothetical protein